ncbi:hypothetical protein [Anaerovorax sp. IOR16]|uniref:hypothetical protein n=1 Tax=Anaerovorax sp. IOR16 TaxID=2773458 RepID=UPI0019CFE8AD|nr:hypothetical protein [Anaerovorax sp. IOR16]
MNTNNNIINKAALTTGNVTAGLLNPEQSRRFIKQTMENTVLGGLIRTEMRKAKTGEIDKIGIGRRLVRKKTEDTDDGNRNKPIFSKVEYSAVAVRLPWEITEETLRENIEGQGLEATITSLMAQAVGIDMEDLWLNADTAVPAEDPDVDFLKVNDGWIKQLLAGSHVIDRATVNGGALTLDVWNDALLEMPNKYNNGKLRWLMSPHRKQAWETYLLDKAITAGGIISDRRIENPYAIPAVAVPSMPDDMVILTDPKNLIVVNTYDVKIRKTTEGKEAIMQDKRFYVIHLDFDPIIEEMDAAVIVKGLADIV